MRITNEHVAELLGTRLERLQRAGSAEPPTQTEGRRGDVVSFSARADDIRAALQAARRDESADRAQLGALSQSVREGGYRIPADRVAEAILLHSGAKPRQA